MEIKVYENNDDRLKLIIVGLPFAYATVIAKTIGKLMGTVQISTIDFVKNDSYVHDDQLREALRYLPLNINPRKLPFASVPYTENNTLTFELNVKNNEKTPKLVYSSSLKWKPTENQKKKFNAKSMGPLYNDILLTVLPPRSEIHAKCVAVKQTRKFGRQYLAGYSVAVPMQRVRFNGEIKGDAAQRLQNVFGTEIVGLQTNADNETVAVLKQDLIEIRSYAIDDDLTKMVEFDRNIDTSSLSIESQIVLKHSELFIESLNRITSLVLNIRNQLNA